MLIYTNTIEAKLSCVAQLVEGPFVVVNYFLSICEF